ncbi:MAG: TetR family transcriptional regulator, partial [Streptosporangiaceae bacterium]
EYLKAAAAAESALADAIARRAGIPIGELESLVLAAAAVAAERAAVLHWARTMAPRSSLADTVRTAVAMAIRCLAGPGSTLA